MCREERSKFLQKEVKIWVEDIRTKGQGEVVRPEASDGRSFFPSAVPHMGSIIPILCIRK